MSKNKFSSSGFIRHLQGLIKTGYFPRDKKLPSVRQLAEQFGVGRQIALFSLGQLVKRHILISVNRKGYFINPEYSAGKFYRIGFLDNESNSLRNAYSSQFYYAALSYGYQLIPVNRFENDEELPEMLKRYPDIDGIIVTGRHITDRMLVPLARGKIPYAVFGTYNISSRHLAVNFRNPEKRFDSVARWILEHDIKSAAIVAGPQSSFSEQHTLSLWQTSLMRKVPGCRIIPVHALNDGYREVSMLLEAPVPPELFIFCGEHCLGYKQYAFDHPGVRLPRAIISQTWQIPMPEELVDFIIPSPSREDFLIVMKEILEKLNCI